MPTKKRYAQDALAFSVLLPLIASAVCSAQAADRLKLSPPAMQVAGIIGAEPLLVRLSSLTAARELGVTGMSLEELSLHQEITEAVVVASLDVDSVMDQIDKESAQ